MEYFLTRDLSLVHAMAVATAIMRWIDRMLPTDPANAGRAPESLLILLRCGERAFLLVSWVFPLKIGLMGNFAG